MYKCKMRAYEGNEPYIFISYAHKDSEQVFPILDYLNDKGYRVWYDDGIVPGSEWPEYIAEHLNSAEVCLAFLSPNSVGSPNCRREINFALSKKKTFLGVFLEETEMSLGMEMQLSSHQCIMKYSYPDESRFFEKLMLAKELEPCKKIVVVKEPEEVVETPTKVVVDTPKVEPVVQPTLTVEPKVEKVVKDLKQEVKKDIEVSSSFIEKQTITPKKQGMPKWLIPVIVAVVAVVGVVGMLLGGGSSSPSGKTVMIANQEIKNDASYISYRNASLTTQDLEQLFALENVTSYNFEDCSLANVDMQTIKNKENVYHMEFVNCTGMTSYDFAGFTKLREVTIDGCNVTDKNIIVDSTVEKFDLSNNPNLTNFGFIDMSTVERLKAAYTGFNDCSILSTCGSLTELNLSGCSLSNIETLTNLPSLTTLNLNDCHTGNFSGSFACLRLETLFVRNNDLTDLSCFDNLTVLKHINLDGNKVNSCNALNKSVFTLKAINISNTLFDSSILEIIHNCALLEELYMNNMKLSTDLSFVSDDMSLEVLYANGCGLQSLEGLENHHDLKILLVANNEITSLDPLSSYTGDSLKLDIRNNALTTLKGMPAVKLKFALCNGNNLTYNPSDFKEGTEIYQISIDYTEDLLNEENKEVFAGTDSICTYVIIADAPMDKVVSIEDMYYSGWLTLVTTDQLNTYLNDIDLFNIYSLDIK